MTVRQKCIPESQKIFGLMRPGGPGAAPDDRLDGPFRPLGSVAGTMGDDPWTPGTSGGGFELATLGP